MGISDKNAGAINMGRQSAEEMKAKRAEHYKQNAETIKAKMRQRYLAKRDEYIKRIKAYCKANPEKTKERGKRYYRKNIAKWQARSNRSEAERQKERDRVKRHNDQNPEQRLKRAAVRRAKKLGVLVGEPFTVTDVIARDGLICYICRLATIPKCSDIKLTPSVDHLKPLIIGGPHSLARAALAHFSCNCSKARQHFESDNVPVDFAARCRTRIQSYLDALD